MASPRPPGSVVSGAQQCRFSELAVHPAPWFSLEFVESTSSPAKLLQLLPAQQLVFTRASLDAPRLQFVTTWRSLPPTGVRGPSVLSHGPGRFTFDRAGEALRARGLNPDEEWARSWRAIDADFRAAVLRTVADHRLNDASNCPGQQVTAYPHVVRGPNTRGLVVAAKSPAGLTAPPM